MNGTFQQLFTWVLVYGYPAIAGAEFASSAGVPLPMTALLLLSGSIAAVGGLNLFLLIFLVAACGVAGDVLDFYIGRHAGGAALSQLAARGLINEDAAKRAQAWLTRYSGIGIFLSRWLLTPISSIVSVLAGVGRYPVRRFLVADVSGELLGAALYLGLGYAVGESWPEIWGFLSSVPGLATAGALGLALIGLGIERLRRARARHAAHAVRVSEPDG
jgi:membrane-associated protein